MLVCHFATIFNTPAVLFTASASSRSQILTEGAGCRDVGELNPGEDGQGDGGDSPAHSRPQTGLDTADEATTDGGETAEATPSDTGTSDSRLPPRQQLSPRFHV